MALTLVFTFRILPVILALELMFPLAAISPEVSTLPNEPVEVDEPLINVLSLSTVNIVELPDFITKAVESAEFMSTVLPPLWYYNFMVILQFRVQKVLVLVELVVM